MVFDVIGVIAPVFTPMDREGDLNLEIIPEYAEYLHREHVRGILVGGTTGENSVLNLAERKLLLEAWMKATKLLGLRVISQVGAEPIPDVLALAEYSQTLGVDAILTLPELYYKPSTVEQLVQYLEAVAAAAPSTPLLYYHFPMMTGVIVNMKQFFSEATARIPTFKGMKADLGVAMQVADTLAPDQIIFIANHHLAASILMGHESSIATVTNVFPALVHEILDAMRRGDLQAARARQERMNRLVDTINSHGDFVPAMKATMAMVTGLNVGPTRKPVPSIKESDKHNLEIQLKALNVL